MKVNNAGLIGYSEDELTSLLREDPTLNLNGLACENPGRYNNAINAMYLNLTPLTQWGEMTEDEAKKYHTAMQENWHMPESYKTMDIVQYLIAMCHGEAELQRLSEELLLFEKFGLMNLLRFLKYLVDILAENNVVLGVGRGSSVASFVLFKLKVHRINSLYYELDINEFLR